MLGACLVGVVLLAGGSETSLWSVSDPSCACFTIVPFNTRPPVVVVGDAA